MNQNNKKTTRNKPIQVYFSKSEKDEIEDIAAEFNTSTSEFIRQSIFEKIRRHKHPEMFDKSYTPQDTSHLVEQMNLLMEKQDLMNQKLNIIDQMQKILDSIYDRSLIGEFAEQTEVVLNLLKGSKSLTRQQIIDATNINEDIVFQIISNKKLFKINVINGKVELRK